MVQFMRALMVCSGFALLGVHETSAARVGRARRSCLASAYRHRVNCEQSLARQAACDCGHPNRRRSAQGWDQRVGVPTGEIARWKVAVGDTRRRGSTNQHEADDRSRRPPLRATLGQAGKRACRIRNPRRDESVYLRLVGFRGATQTAIEMNPSLPAASAQCRPAGLARPSLWGSL
jgi:hypothetical protein